MGKTASETLEWIEAIIQFIEPYRFLIDAFVVNFFTHGLWESVDKEWMDCLRNDPMENLLQIPSGIVHDHWPSSLKEFVLTARSLCLRREQVDLEEEFPGLRISSLNSVVAQGMNHKKKHEIEVVAALISSVAREVKSNTVIDVGAGQGYLTQVLSFEHELSVFAIDACSGHGEVTDARAERIKKHYAARLRKSGSENRELSVPKTVTCQVLSANTLKALSNSLLEDAQNSEQLREGPGKTESLSSSHGSQNSSMVLAGLHACGDLSVTMLRTFLDSDKVKAVISIGCCYNLLSEEEGTKGVSSLCGFPMSKGVKSAGFALGRNACDLACECAERWRSLAKVAGPNNFEMHGFRAAFQMVLSRYYPEILLKRPRLGRQGKALRRQQHWRFLKNNLNHENSGNTSVSLSQKTYKDEGSWFPIACPKNQTVEGKVIQCDDDASYCESSNENSIYGAASSVDEYPQFIKFCQSGLGHLGLHHSQDIDFRGVWEETKPFAGLIGPYWSIRAALGPILETLLLLDRLLFLQEHGKDVEAVMLPIFNPILSPRNVALIAKKT